MQPASIRKLFALIATAILTAGVITACASSSPPSSGSAGSSSSNTSSASVQTVSSSSASSFSPTSIVRFDGIENARKLVADMAAGATPTSCTVCYDQMGTRPAVTVTDPATIADIYGKLSAVSVEGPSDESITDSYHFVGFVLQDGTNVTFSFEGEGLLSLGRENYRVSGAAALWSLVRHIQDEYMEAEGISAG